MNEKLRSLIKKHQGEPEMLAEIEKAARDHSQRLRTNKRKNEARVKARKVARRSRKINR